MGTEQTSSSVPLEEFDRSLTKKKFLSSGKLPLGGGSSSSDFHSTRDFHQ